ncbi:hypothetical protein KGF54_003386 [Candida jiufengensis]|uniref:uncharacterized protein n=1 Tax=Candida jiufengensis TaxID=497108 RepID=UPI00222428EB|nr:uncharacterized protein KGF54_003386 [Candida jiufengensis]KAI5952519.1 hypothetical protein KGF54_003386 [Candida jiufengensis]
MKYTTIASTASFLTTILAATVPSAPWSTLTPKASIPTDATTNYSQKFGIQIVTVEDASALATETVANLSSKLETKSAKLKRAVAQITDGQVQHQTTAAPVAQITDGQIQHQTTAAAVSVINQITDGQIQHQTTAAAVAQIGDGQIQHQTTAAAVSVINQIGDGQIQHQTTAAAASVVNQIGDGQIQHQTTAAAASVVNQIGDGQIQHQTTAAAASVVNQIGDGQIQHQTTAAAVNQIGDGQIQHQTTAAAVNQIGDGQIQHQNSTVAAAHQISDGQIQHPTTATAAHQITDGQIQHQNGTVAAESFTAAPTTPASGIQQACSSSNNLVMTLKDSLLTDGKGRVGAIVANRQFQFDGPPPQAGTLIAAGWSISKDGFLQLGDSTVFYQCLSGDFYNLYDENVAAQCNAVKLRIIDFVDC